MKKIKDIIKLSMLSLAFLSCLSTFLGGQCTTIHGLGDFSQPVDAWDNTGDKAGQTFLATSNGGINSISIGLGANTAPGITVNLRIATLPSPLDAVLTTPVVSSAVTTGGAQNLQFTLSSSFQVTNGSSYVFEIENASGGVLSLNVSFSGLNYNDGFYYEEVDDIFDDKASQDYDFEIEVCVEEEEEEEATEVPMMGYQKLFLLSMLVLSFSLFYILRQKML